MKTILLFLLIPMMSFSQVGINTKTPTATLEVNGDVKIRATIGTINDTILVIRNNKIYKVPASYYYTLQNSCPVLVVNQSSGYYLLFQSVSSIDNPNNPITVQGKTFTSAGTWIVDNTYYFSYTNTTGIAININQPFTVMFGNQSCNY